MSEELKNEKEKVKEYVERYSSIYDIFFKSYVDIYTIEGIIYIKNNGDVDGFFNNFKMFVSHYLELLKSDLAVNICKLYTDTQNKANTIEHFKNYIKDAFNKDLSGINTSLEKFSNVIKNIKALRDTYLSHNDKEHSKVSIELEDMKSIIEELRGIFNKLCFSDIDTQAKPFTDSLKSYMDFSSKFDQMEIMIRDRIVSEYYSEKKDEY